MGLLFVNTFVSVLLYDFDTGWHGSSNDADGRVVDGWTDVLGFGSVRITR